MNQINEQMYAQIEQNESILDKNDQWLNKEQIKMIINKLTASQYYQDIQFFEIKKNVISFTVFNQQFQKKNLIVFEKGIKEIDKTNRPYCYFQEELTVNILMKEFDIQQQQKTQKEYSFQDLIDAQQEFELVKIIREDKKLNILVNNLSLCTNLVEFHLVITQANFTNDQDQKNFLLHIAECFKNCYHLQLLEIQIIIRVFDKCQIEQFIDTTTQFENLNKYILTLNSLQLDLNALQNIGNSFRNFKKLNKLETHIWSDNLNHEGVTRLYSQISYIKSLKKLRIDLQQNAIQSQGAIKLGNCLEKFEGLTKLKIDLWDNKIQLDGLDNLINSICKIQSLRHLEFFIWNNNMSYEEIAQALEKLSYKTKIYCLDLIFDQDSKQPQNVSFIIRKFRSFSKIYWLQIDEFSPKLNEEIKLVQAIKKNKRLVHFKQVSGLKY
ncbi:hypothetical protein ABPG72_011539 [Tetrahymena utriculariae]